MNKAKQVRKLIFLNVKALIGFEALFKLLTLFLFAPMFWNSFNLIMQATGYTYLTFENIVSFILHPLALFSLLILVLLMMIYNMFHIATVVLILDQSYHGKKINLSDAVRFSLNKCRKMFGIQNLPLAFMTLFLIPFLNLGMASGFISTINVPEFILDYIAKNGALLALFFLAFFFLSALLLHWMYALHYFVLEDISFKEARKCSKRIGQKHHLKDLFSLSVTQISLAFLYYLFVVAGIFLIVLLDSLLEIILIKSIVSAVIWMFIAISFLLFLMLSFPINYAAVSVLYYSHKKEKGEEIPRIEIPEKARREKAKKGWRFLKIRYVIPALFFVLGIAFTYGLYEGDYNLNIEYVRTTEVTAHRGASLDYPENTMSAFKGAKRLGADWIELDVQQTKDGEIIVIHDSNFKRTTGVDKNIWELTYPEVRELDAGLFFDEAFRGERIPLLSEVVAFAKSNHIKLNIELKPSGHETDFEKKVIDIIRDFRFENDCVITSQIYRVLENVKAYDSSVKTVYVMSLAYGEITRLTAADSFSIEASSVSEALISRIHQEGKELYAWTVNTEESIRRMMEMNVDNIITDNISLAREVIFAGKTSDMISEYIKFLESIF